MRLLRARHFYGRQNSRYMTRVFLPGDYKLHLFYRGDEDPDPHDHPWDFWTFPLTSYYEEVWRRDSEDYLVPTVRLVKALRWHWRPAEHIHRVLGRQPHHAPEIPQRIVTIVKTLPRRREWGFWSPDRDSPGDRGWVDWREYLSLPSDFTEEDYE